MSAPDVSILPTFLVTMALEMSEYFTQKVPPKPQQTSESVISLTSTPLTLPSSLRGCSLMPSSRNPEQES
jgi:hypothetical protein